MQDLARDSRDPTDRINSRLQRRYARWLVNQPTACTCRAPGWRTFWRTWRRRLQTLGKSRLLQLAAICLVVCGGVLVVGLAVAVVAGIVVCSPLVFFAAPEDHIFANQAEYAAVALTRLTVLQTLALWLLVLLTVRRRTNPDGLMRKFYRARDLVLRHGWRIGLACIVACSAAVSLGATLGQPNGLAAALAGLLAISCLTWMAFGLARRLTAVRLPGNLSDPGVQAALLLIPMFLVLPAGVVLYKPAVLRISQQLDWMGPLGWINGSILQFSQGRWGNFWPFVVLCAVLALVGRTLTQRTRTWAFRRRLLSVVRSEQQPPIKRPGKIASHDFIVRDLRTTLAAAWWSRAALWPSWLRGKLGYLLLLWGSVLAAQLLFGGLVLFLAGLERTGGVAKGDAFMEKQLFDSLVAYLAGWSVMMFELAATLLRDVFSHFTRRPVSAVGLWWDLQRKGLRATPQQAIFSLPFLLIPALLSPAHLQLAAISLAVGLVTCLGIRTAIGAAVCYGSAIVSLRASYQIPLRLVGLLASMGLFVAAFGRMDSSPFQTFACQLLIVPAAMVAFAAAWGLRQVLSRPRRFLRWCW